MLTKFRINKSINDDILVMKKLINLCYKSVYSSRKHPVLLYDIVASVVIHTPYSLKSLFSRIYFTPKNFESIKCAAMLTIAL